MNSKKSKICRRNAWKKAIKIPTKALYNKESRTKLKRIADKELVDIIDDVADCDTYLDAETIPYAEPYRDTSKKDKIYRKKAKKKTIKILNKKRKLKSVAGSSDEKDNSSDAETIPYAKPYRNPSFPKKTKYIGKKQKKKAIKTLTTKKTLAKKTKTIKVVDPKEEDDDYDPELVITGFKAISYPRTREQFKEKEIARGNSAAVQADFTINPEDFLDVPMLFNLRMIDKMEIEDWLVDNLAVNNDEYYIEHKQGTNVFRIRKEPDSESNNSEMVLTNLTINPLKIL